MRVLHSPAAMSVVGFIIRKVLAYVLGCPCDLLLLLAMKDRFMGLDGVVAGTLKRS
jgi:hypothetical protein